MSDTRNFSFIEWLEINREKIANNCADKTAAGNSTTDDDSGLGRSDEYDDVPDDFVKVETNPENSRLTFGRAFNELNHEPKSLTKIFKAFNALIENYEKDGISADFVSDILRTRAGLDRLNFVTQIKLEQQLEKFVNFFQLFHQIIVKDLFDEKGEFKPEVKNFIIALKKPNSTDLFISEENFPAYENLIKKEIYAGYAMWIYSEIINQIKKSRKIFVDISFTNLLYLMAEFSNVFFYVTVNDSEKRNWKIDRNFISGSELNPPIFSRKQKLNPREIYASSIGVFKTNGFKLKHIVGSEIQGVAELARVYQRVEDGKLYIIYYPGKDNKSKDVTLGTQSLDNILNLANAELEKKFTVQQLKNSKKIAIVCENNTYFGRRVNHYIKADLSDGKLTTVDSMDRNYNENEIEKLFPHTKREKIKRDWQDLSDDWSCAHYCLQELKWDLTGQDIPRKLEITQEVLNQNSAFYHAGLKAIANPKIEAERAVKLKANNIVQTEHQHHDYSTMDGEDFFPVEVTQTTTTTTLDAITTTTPSIKNQQDLSKPETQNSIEDLASNLPIPVGGKIGKHSQDCYLSISRFTAALKNYNQDKNLEIVLDKNSDKESIHIRVCTTRPLPLLDALGIKYEQKGGMKSYQITIVKQDKNYNPKFSDPLFALNIHVGNETKLLDVSRLLNTNEVRTLANNARNVVTNTDSNKRALVKNSEISNVLEQMRSVNKYLTARSKKTSAFLSIFNSYNGNDYYARRESWIKILEKMSSDDVTSDKLKKFILIEAKKFNNGILSNDYYQSLMCLHDQIDKSFVAGINFSAQIKEKISAYQQMYAHMTQYRWEAYLKQGSKPHMMEREKELYAAQYSLLDARDQATFSTAEEEHESEKKNVKHW